MVHFVQVEKMRYSNVEMCLWEREGHILSVGIYNAVFDPNHLKNDPAFSSLNRLCSFRATTERVQAGVHPVLKRF